MFLLQNSKYKLLERIPIKLINDDYQWTFWCSFESNRSREVANLDSDLKITIDGSSIY